MIDCASHLAKPAKPTIITRIAFNVKAVNIDLIFILHILIDYFLNRIYADKATAEAICSAEGFSAYPPSLNILFAENDL